MKIIELEMGAVGCKIGNLLAVASRLGVRGLAVFVQNDDALADEPASFATNYLP
jgi:hypothetical protein